MTLLRSCLATTVVLSTLSCGQPTEGPQTTAAPGAVTAKLSVYVVNYPLAYFAERIGGDLVEVTFPAPSGEDPAYWAPDADTIAAYQGADLILLNGAGYAKWVDRAALPTSKMVDTSASFASQFIPLEGTVTHSHGPEGSHEHTGWAFTTWLDPTLAIEQAAAVSRSLIERLPVYEAIFNERHIALEADLSSLDARQAAAADRIADTPLLFSHPVYQYLERRYGLNGTSVHWEPDQPLDLNELRRVLEQRRATWMVWEAEPLPQAVTTLESWGVRSVVYDPCANRPAQGDLMSVMAANAGALEEIAANSDPEH